MLQDHHLNMHPVMMWACANPKVQLGSHSQCIYVSSSLCFLPAQYARYTHQHPTPPHATMLPASTTTKSSRATTHITHLYKILLGL